MSREDKEICVVVYEAMDVPIRIKFLWFIPILWVFVKYKNWNYNRGTLWDGDTFDNNCLTAFTVKSVEITITYY